MYYILYEGLKIESNEPVYYTRYCKILIICLGIPLSSKLLMVFHPGLWLYRF